MVTYLGEKLDQFKKPGSYALITAARNEAKYLPALIECIIGQTLLPVKWIVVSDGSEDNTDEIVRKASMHASFIELVRFEGRKDRCFSSKAVAFMTGYERLGSIAYQYVGNLDADVTLDARYYERMIEMMESNSRLGVASGVVWEKKEKGFERVLSSLNHAVGAVQFWRKECFEEVGGYVPVSVGGIDAIAESKARMFGWETRSFPDLKVYHHRPIDGSDGRSTFEMRFRAGMTEYHIGTDPLFALLKAIRRWREKPALLSVMIRLSAYGKLWIRGTRRDAPEELVRYLRKEQRRRIIQTLLGRFDWL